MQRWGVRKISTGGPVKGASTTNSASRSVASALGSPPSRASIHCSVAAREGIQPKLRRPVATPPMGISSRSGRRARAVARLPVASQISTTSGNRYQGTL